MGMGMGTHHEVIEGPGVKLAVAAPPRDCGRNIGERFAINRHVGCGAAIGKQRGHQPRVVASCCNPERTADSEKVCRQPAGAEVSAGSQRRRRTAGWEQGAPTPAPPPARDPTQTLTATDPDAAGDGDGRSGLAAVVSSCGRGLG